MEPCPPFVLLPLDGRPDQLHLPVYLARLAGRTVALPPPELLGPFPLPGQPEALGRWLCQQTTAEAVLVAADMLAYGGGGSPLPRNVPDSAALAHLSVLEEMRSGLPRVPVLVFSVRTHDPPFHRRLMEYLAQGVIDYLLLAQEEGPLQAEWGVGDSPAAKAGVENRLSRPWGKNVAVLMLLARAVLQAHPSPLRVALHCSYPPRTGPEETLLPGGNPPLGAMVAAHLETLAAVVAPNWEEADIALFVHTPPGPEVPSLASPGLRAFTREIAQALVRGPTVVLADVASPQGTDPLLMEELASCAALPGLAGYAAKGTASDRLGMALVHGCITAVAWSSLGKGEDSERKKHLSTVFPRQFQKMTQLLQAEKCLVLLLDETRQWLTPLPIAQGFTPAQLEALKFPAKGDFWGLALALQSVRLEAEPSLDLPGSQEVLADLGARNGLMVPLLSRRFRQDLLVEEERPMGLLGVFNKRRGAFTEEDETLLALLSRQTSAIVRNMRRSEAEREHQETQRWLLTVQLQQQLLLRRFFEDWGYQTVVRPEVERHLPAGVSPADLGAAHHTVEVQVRERMQAWTETFLAQHWAGRTLPGPPEAGPVRLPSSIPCRFSLPGPSMAEIEIEVPLTLEVIPTEKRKE